MERMDSPDAVHNAGCSNNLMAYTRRTAAFAYEDIEAQRDLVACSR
jgi:hypothetical protein